MKQRFLNLAEKISYLSEHVDHKHGAVVVYKNRILGLGKNSIKTHPKSPDIYAKTIHAELAAILNSHQNEFEGCEIYVVRRNKLNELALSRPCANCMRLLKQLRISYVHYSVKNGYKSEKL